MTRSHFVFMCFLVHEINRVLLSVVILFVLVILAITSSPSASNQVNSEKRQCTTTNEFPDPDCCRRLKVSV